MATNDMTTCHDDNGPNWIFVIVLAASLIGLPIAGEYWGPKGFAPTYWVCFPLVLFIGFVILAIYSRSLWFNALVVVLFWTVLIGEGYPGQSWSSALARLQKDAAPTAVAVCIHAGFQIMVCWISRRLSPHKPFGPGFPVIASEQGTPDHEQDR